MHHRLKGQVAALNVKGESVNLHPAGAGHNLVIPVFHNTFTVDSEKRGGWGFVFLCPGKKRKKFNYVKQ